MTTLGQNRESDALNPTFGVLTIALGSHRGRRHMGGKQYREQSSLGPTVICWVVILAVDLPGPAVSVEIIVTGEDNSISNMRWSLPLREQL